jgi:hypothetical protein
LKKLGFESLLRRRCRSPRRVPRSVPFHTSPRVERPRWSRGTGAYLRLQVLCCSSISGGELSLRVYQAEEKSSLLFRMWIEVKCKHQTAKMRCGLRNSWYLESELLISTWNLCSCGPRYRKGLYSALFYAVSDSSTGHKANGRTQRQV